MNKPEIIGYSQDGPMDQWGAKLQSPSEGASHESPGPAKVVAAVPTGSGAFRALTLGQRRPNGYEVRPHGKDWEKGYWGRVGEKITKMNLQYADFRAPVPPNG